MVEQAVRRHVKAQAIVRALRAIGISDVPEVHGSEFREYRRLSEYRRKKTDEALTALHGPPPASCPCCGVDFALEAMLRTEVPS